MKLWAAAAPQKDLRRLSTGKSHIIQKALREYLLICRSSTIFVPVANCGIGHPVRCLSKPAPFSFPQIFECRPRVAWPPEMDIRRLAAHGMKKSDFIVFSR